MTKAADQRNEVVDTIRENLVTALNSLTKNSIDPTHAAYFHSLAFMARQTWDAVVRVERCGNETGKLILKILPRVKYVFPYWSQFEVTKKLDGTWISSPNMLKDPP